MLTKAPLLLVCCLALAACTFSRSGDVGKPREPGGTLSISTRQPLIIGESFTLDSVIMAEPRPINVFIPTVYGQKIDKPLPVLYMLDGGIDEDFLHVAGLVQVLVSNNTMRPFMLVGIPNTQRRRDMTGPTANVEDKKIAPVVGGSATFRAFIKDELMPTVRSRYRTTGEAAIIGESLAGLFVVETFFLEPELFNSSIALDPSLWWADQSLLKSASTRLDALHLPPSPRKSLFIATSSEPQIAQHGAQLAATFAAHSAAGLSFHYTPMPAETHATIYHPAALVALRTVLAPPPAK